MMVLVRGHWSILGQLGRFGRRWEYEDRMGVGALLCLGA